MMKTVLIVEDEVHIATAEKMILEQNYIVHLAHDGEAGLEMAKKVKPDVIVLDVMMPKMSGFEVCKAIRAERGLKNSKIIMVTAKNQEKDEVHGLDLGADDYIMKPFEPEELMHVVDQMLDDKTA